MVSSSRSDLCDRVFLAPVGGFRRLRRRRVLLIYLSLGKTVVVDRGLRPLGDLLRVPHLNPRRADSVTGQQLVLGHVVRAGCAVLLGDTRKGRERLGAPP